MTIAALPMYDWPEARAVVNAEWADLRARFLAAGIDAPEKLARCNGDLPAVPGGILDAEGRVIAPDPATLPPDELDYPTLWKHPDLLFAQTCWGPMEEGLEKHVVVIGQPSYDGFEGGRGELYSSALLMRRKVISGDSREGWCSFAPPSGLPAISPTGGEISSFDEIAISEALAAGESRGAGLISPLVGEMAGRPEGGDVEPGHAEYVASPSDGRAILPLDLLGGKRFAYNGTDSMSGILALTRDLEAAGENLAIFSERIETGAHRTSIVAVAEGRADVCAVDCRSWQLAQAYEQRAADLRVVGWTAQRKGLPFITSRHTPVETVAKLRSVLSRP